MKVYIHDYSFYEENAEEAENPKTEQMPYLRASLTPPRLRTEHLSSLWTQSELSGSAHGAAHFFPHGETI